jgi:hypothetical protein
MKGCLIEFTSSGRVKSVYLIGMTDRDVAVVEHGLARITTPSCWAWLRRLLRRVSSWPHQSH